MLVSYERRQMIYTGEMFVPYSRDTKINLDGTKEWVFNIGQIIPRLNQTLTTCDGSSGWYTLPLRWRGWEAVEIFNYKNSWKAGPSLFYEK